MGYRSQVIFGVKKGLESKLKNVFAEFQMDEHFSDEEVNYKDIFEDKGYQVVFDNYWIVYTGDYLKWYEEFDDVKGITEVIKELHEKEDNAFMVALGECGETHSEIGEWYNYVDCMRYLKLAI